MQSFKGINMAQTVLMVYENLESFRENREYWTSYVEFYEKYWDAPASPKSSWWGNEYEEFRQSLSKQLGLDKNYIRDCFFTKDKDGRYFICPIGSEVNLNIISCDNFVPLEWFTLFESGQKGYFYTHTGFGAIHHDAIYYTSDLKSSLVRLENSVDILSSRLNTDKEEFKKYPELQKFGYVLEGVNNIREWLGGFSDDGILILNYGEICSFIEPDSMKNEDSVGELFQILENLKSGDFSSAASNFKLLDYKWTDIESKASGDPGWESLQ